MIAVGWPSQSIEVSLYMAEWRAFSSIVEFCAERKVAKTLVGFRKRHNRIMAFEVECSLQNELFALRKIDAQHEMIQES